MSAQPQSGSVRRWFEASDFLLAIDQLEAHRYECASKPLAAMDGWLDAVLLDEQGPLLQCIANWAQNDFDWQPLTNTSNLSLDMTVASLAGTQRTLGLVCPAHNTQLLPTLPESLSTLLSVQHHKEQVRVCLDEFVLTAEELEKCETGGFVLLSGSFHSSWVVQLHSFESSQTVLAARLDPASASLSPLSQPCELVEDGDKRIRVLLHEHTLLDHNHRRSDKADIQSGVMLPIPPLEQSAVDVEIITSEGVTVFEASLLRIGNGFAVRLDRAAAGVTPA